jgi:hypothetical protein
MAQQTQRKYVFVCGLPRSGTSLLGRNIGRLENCTDLKNTGAIEDEGQYVQDVYPTAYEFGGAGRFGFDPQTHRTEASPLLTSENVAKLHASWHKYWDNSKSIFVEKTPGNLLMTRFLQAAFPNAYFVVVRRHPVPVGMAAQKWKVNVTSLSNMFDHWLHCHAIFDEDRKYLNHVYELRYEDYVETPERYHKEIAGFIGTRVPEPPKDDRVRVVAQWPNIAGLRVPERGMEQTSGVHNQKYFDRWRKLLNESVFKSYYRHIARKYEPQFTKHGYSLISDCGVDESILRANGKVSDSIGALCCLGADFGALLWRAAVRSKEKMRLVSKAVLPEFVIGMVRHSRQRRTFKKQKSEGGGHRSDVRGPRTEVRGTVNAER